MTEDKLPLPSIPSCSLAASSNKGNNRRIINFVAFVPRNRRQSISLVTLWLWISPFLVLLLLTMLRRKGGNVVEAYELEPYSCFPKSNYSSLTNLCDDRTSHSTSALDVSSLDYSDPRDETEANFDLTLEWIDLA